MGRPLVPFRDGSPPGLVSERGDVAVTIAPIVAGKILHVTPTIEAIREVVAPGAGLETHVTGFTGIVSDYNSAIKEADVKLLAATVVLVLLLLIGVYRSPLLALVPLVVVGIAFSIANGMVYVLNRTIELPVDSSSTSLLLVLMFGAGTDYCLLLVSRYGVKLRQRESAEQALREALPEAAVPMIASGLTVIAALLTMLAGDRRHLPDARPDQRDGDRSRPPRRADAPAGVAATPRPKGLLAERARRSRRPRTLRRTRAQGGGGRSRCVCAGAPRASSPHRSRCSSPVPPRSCSGRPR